MLYNKCSKPVPVEALGRAIYTPSMAVGSRAGAVGWPLRPMATWSLAVALGATALTLTVALSDLQFAVRSAEGRIALETAQMIIAGLVAFLLWGRSGRTGLLRDSFIAAAFVTFSSTSLLFLCMRMGGAPEDGSRLERVAIWAPLMARTGGTALLAVASSINPNRRAVHRNGAGLLLASIGLVAAATLVALSLAERLPQGLSEELLFDASRVAGTRADISLQILQLLLVVLYGIAALGFVARQSNASADPLDITLAAGFTAAAFARLNFYLYPSIYTDVVHVGDFLRLFFFMILLVGATMEIHRYWRVESESAAVLERERLARELHDGLSQELAFISSQTAAMAKGTSYPGMVELVAQSADRAVTESRALLLTIRGDEMVSARDALAAAAKRAAGSRAAVEIDIPTGLLLPVTASHELGRIILEATANALRHGAAGQIRVTASTEDGDVKVVIADDGEGFDPDDPMRGRQGIRGMRERAELLGGTMRIRSQQRVGTTVEVVLPDPRARANKRGRR